MTIIYFGPISRWNASLDRQNMTAFLTLDGIELKTLLLQNYLVFYTSPFITSEVGERNQGLALALIFKVS